MQCLFAFTSTFYPVEANGRLAKRAFYFRARGNRWTFALTEDPSVDPATVRESSRAAFFRSGEVGEPGDNYASDMPLKHAEEIIFQCAAEYMEAMSASE
jgi:hypothetical protein